MGRVPLDMENAGVTYIRMDSNYRLPFGHNHKNQEEVYVVVGGSGHVKLGDDVRELKQWDAVRVHKDTMRGFEADADGARDHRDRRAEHRPRRREHRAGLVG